MTDGGRKIVPFLWFASKSEEAVQLYTSVFENSRIVRVTRFGEAGPGPAGSVMSVDFTLSGQEFGAINGGPYYTFTPAVSFFVSCATSDELDRYWSVLVDGGTVLMPLDGYGFSERFGWLNDRFGVSWQFNLAPRDQKIAPCVMFIGTNHGKAEEAVTYYASLFDGGAVVSIEKYGPGEHEPEGTVKHAIVSLAGQELMAIDSGLDHRFEITGAISFLVKCGSQTEIDRFWGAFSDGGVPQQCGWVQDRYGVMWQVVPPILAQMLHDRDAARANRVTQAMLQMVKLDIAALEHAYNQA